MRRDMKLHKYRAIMRSLMSTQLKSFSSHIMKNSPKPDYTMDWLLYENLCLLHSELSVSNTMIISSGLIGTVEIMELK